MYSVNLLTLIAEHLPWNELLNFSLVSLTCYQIAQNEDLWKREVQRFWTSSGELYGEVIHGYTALRKGVPATRWKVIMKKSITSLALWKTLANSGLQEEEAVSLAISVFQVMKDPLPPAPTLRREARAFGTIFQDFWAYGHRECCPTEPDANFSFFVAFLEASQYELKAEVETPVDLELLAVARWHAIKGDISTRSSTATSSLSASDLSAESPTTPDFELSHFTSRRMRTAQPALLWIYYCLKKAISFRCQLNLRLLHDCSTSLQLLSTYVNLWNSYAASALRLHEVFRGYTDLLQNLYEEKWMGGSGPAVSIVRMMALAWRRKVYTPLESVINESLVELLRVQRSAVILQVQSSSPRSYRRYQLEDAEGVLLQSAFQAFIDLSVHERSVLFLDHSQVQLEQPYLTIHTAVMEQGRELLRVADPLLFQRGVQADLKFLKRLVTVFTYREMESLYATQEALLWKHHFLSLQSTSWVRVPPSLLETDPLLNSEFGLMLFSACPNRASVKAFVEFLLAVDVRNKALMERYVVLVQDLSEKYELDDEKVDFEAERFQCSRAQLASSCMYSLLKDVRMEDLQLLSLREDMQICD